MKIAPAFTSNISKWNPAEGKLEIPGSLWRKAGLPDVPLVEIKDVSARSWVIAPQQGQSVEYAPPETVHLPVGPELRQQLGETERQLTAFAKPGVLTIGLLFGRQAQPFEGMWDQGNLIGGLARNTPLLYVPRKEEEEDRFAFRSEDLGNWRIAGQALLALLLIYLLFLGIFWLLAYIKLQDHARVAEQWPVAFALWAIGSLERIAASLAMPATVFVLSMQTQWKDIRRHLPVVGVALLDMSPVALPSFAYLYAVGSEGFGETWMFLCAVALAYLLQIKFKALENRFVCASTALVILASSIQAYDWVRRSSPLAVEARNVQQKPGVALALSGGGYRAAVLHTGVLEALEELQVPVSQLVTVSGGSIIGAYYALGGRPQAFADGVGAGHFNAVRRLMLPVNLLRLPSPLLIPFTDVSILPVAWEFSRTDIQREMLESLVVPRGTKFEKNPSAGLPRLMVCTTDIWSGQAVGLTGLGLVRHRLPRSIDRIERGAVPVELAGSPVAFDKGAPEIELAEAVAASGAFPVALPPVRYGNRFMLGDGGLFDNLGLTLLLDAHYLQLDGWSLSRVIVSDGSQLALRGKPEGSRALASVPDIVYANYAKAPPPKGTVSTPPIRILSPSEFVAPETGRVDARALNAAIGRAKAAEAVGDKARAWLGQKDLAARLTEAINVFRTTSTLSDQIEPERVKQLVFLGKSLVYLDATAILSDSARN